MTSTTPNATRFSILQSSHMTAAIGTESGSRYTVVTRPKVGVVLIKDNAGLVSRGSHLKIKDGCLFLFKNKDDRQPTAWTTRITSVYIMSN